jgi:SAM-dependent methyltransferase
MKDDILGQLEANTDAKRRQFHEDLALWSAFERCHGLSDWESWYSPYDEDVYSQALTQIDECDVVLDVGAGDLRLALRIAEIARRVYAVECNPRVLGPALETIGLSLPRNLHAICANALDFSIPPGLTAAVLLMRHCQHFGDYFDRLQRAGCRKLITNARWKIGLETIDLTAPRWPFEQVSEGWYACRCGDVGYIGAGTRVDAAPVETATCPACSTYPYPPAGSKMTASV